LNFNTPIFLTKKEKLHAENVHVGVGKQLNQDTGIIDLGIVGNYNKQDYLIQKYFVLVGVGRK